MPVNQPANFLHDARAFKNESNKIGTPIACHVSCLAENRTFKRIS